MIKYKPCIFLKFQLLKNKKNVLGIKTTYSNTYIMYVFRTQQSWTIQSLLIVVIRCINCSGFFVHVNDLSGGVFVSRNVFVFVKFRHYREYNYIDEHQSRKQNEFKNLNNRNKQIFNIRKRFNRYEGLVMQLLEKFDVMNNAWLVATWKQMINHNRHQLRFGPLKRTIVFFKNMYRDIWLDV